MITRYVRLTLKHDQVELFKSIFGETKDKILSSKGCLSVDLYQDINQPERVATLSTWTSTECLDEYRRSDLFVTTWARVKPLFSAGAEAVSYVKVED